MQTRRRVSLLTSLVIGTIVQSSVAEPAQRVVVTATRVATPLKEVGSSISLITAEDLERAKVQDISDALHLVPGVGVARNGGPGQVTSVFLRGAPAGFTRVMIDGVEVNDPSGIGTAYDFAHLNVTGIDRIEVLRGPQSTLYGGDAMAGVINIITKQGDGAPTCYVNTEGGSYETWRLGAGTRGRQDALHYAFDVSYHQTDGFSNFDKKDGYSERDGYENTTLSGRVGYDVSDLISLSTIVRYVQANTDYDTFDAAFAPTEEGRTENEQAIVRLEGKASLLDGVWEQTLGVSKTMHRRDFVGVTGVENSSFDGDLLAFDWQHNVFSEMQTFTFGIDWQEDESDNSGEKKVNFDVMGYYLQDTISPVEQWHTSLGVRLDDHSAFGSEATYRVATAYLLEDLGSKLKASWGTGFKAPSLFELFASSPYVEGNPDLDPQTSTGWDVGFEQSILADRVGFGATYFNISYEDLIAYTATSFDAVGTYVNQNEAESRGVEVYVTARPHEQVDLRLDYTYLDNEDKSSGNGFELRRPENQVSATVGYQPTGRLAFTLYGVYVGSRLDFGDVKLDEYALVNLAASYDITEQVEGYVRVENLFDEDYQQVDAYGTAGIAAYAGVKGSF